ncbi:MAG: DNA polymerase III subunit chi [Methylophaga sp.]|nr:DNA polymerase III subunit chi [Methylophaga sp.]
MTSISFYILKGDIEHNRQVLACRLTSKAYYQGQTIYIHTDNAEQAEQVNQALWSFRAESFIPHNLINENNDDCQVLIGHDSKPPRLMDLLINLASEQPLFFSQFDRVAEFVNDHSDVKAAGRKRYQFYKQRGYEIETHSI